MEYKRQGTVQMGRSRTRSNYDAEQARVERVARDVGPTLGDMIRQQDKLQQHNDCCLPGPNVPYFKRRNARAPRLADFSQAD